MLFKFENIVFFHKDACPSCIVTLCMFFFPVQRVTPWNVKKLRQAIINGPDVHPGATHYSDRVSTMKLPPTKKARIAIARKLLSSRGVNTELGKTCDVNFECKTVYRHMQDGDVVLVNRQVWTYTVDFIDTAYLNCFLSFLRLMIESVF